MRFADEISFGDADLRLQGTGLLRYRVFIKGYVAALYLDEESSGGEVLGDRPRRLEIEYFWSIPADKFGDAMVEGIRRNTDAATFARIRGKDLFDKIVENLAAFTQRLRERALERPRVSLWCVGMKENIDEMPALMRAWVGMREMS